MRHGAGRALALPGCLTLSGCILHGTRGYSARTCAHAQRVLGDFCSNIIQRPRERAFRKIRLRNPNFQVRARLDRPEIENDSKLYTYV